MRSGRAPVRPERVAPGPTGTPGEGGRRPIPLHPRVRRSRAAILAATLGLLAERGPAGVSIEAIAERSGVAKTTIYRQWPSATDVVRAAFESAIVVPTIAVSGDTRADLEAMTLAFAEAMSEGTWARLLPSLIQAAEHDPAVADVLRRVNAERERVVEPLIEAAVKGGEFPSGVDVDEIAALLSGALFFQRLVAREPLTPDLVRRFVAVVLRGYGFTPRLAPPSRRA